MLREYETRQVKGEPRRRWFSDDFFDLIVWMSDDSTPWGFQLCYDLLGEERALTWNPESGYSHRLVDSGEGSPEKNLTPILVPDGAFPGAKILAAFQERSGEVDPLVREFVLDKLRGFRA